MHIRKVSGRALRALKISSQYVGQWIVRPVVQVIERESLKLERLIERTHFESDSRQPAIRDEILAKIADLAGSVEAIAREMERKSGLEKE